MAPVPKIGDWQSAPATASRPVFAIGDIHGRNDLFEPLVAAILRIVDEEKLEKVALVTSAICGPRPASLAVLKKVLDGNRHPKVQSICLPGNHEQFLRHFLESKGAERRDILWNWLDNGAGAIAQELGFSEAKVSDPDTFVAAIASDLGLDRIEKLFKLNNHYRLDQYLFVHGGIHPQFGLAALKRDWRRLPRADSTRTAIRCGCAARSSPMTASTKMELSSSTATPAQRGGAARQPHRHRHRRLFLRPPHLRATDG